MLEGSVLDHFQGAVSYSAPQVQNSFERFRQAFEEKYATLSDVEKNEEGVQQLKVAIENHAFKARAFQPQPIYAENGIITYELLCRPQLEGYNFNMEKMSRAVEKLGLSIDFDIMLTRGALKKFQENQDVRPVSINASVESVLSTRYWEQVLPLISVYGGENATIEILENEVPNDADISLLEQIKKEYGVRFALDDMTLSKRDMRRLFTFGDLIDEVKVDGPVVRDYLEHGASEMETLLNIVANRLPNADLVAERVYDGDEVDHLFKTFLINGVQGYDLKPKDFPLANDAKYHTDLDDPSMA